MRTLFERLKPIERKCIENEGKEFPHMAERVTDALKAKCYWSELTISEAMMFQSLLSNKAFELHAICDAFEDE